MLIANSMNHHNLVVVHYNSYAGGKFWINCLSHSAGAIPGLAIAPGHDSDLWVFDNLSLDEFQQRKISRINYSLPDRRNMTEWCMHELGCTAFWGDTLGAFLDSTKLPADNAIRLLDQHVCFIVNHKPQDFMINEIRQKLPNARHIIMANADNFQRVSMSIKQDDPWPMTYDTYNDPDAFIVDVDQTYMDVDRTITRVKECLEYLGLSTELDPNIHNFVTNYFNLHR